jgi:hypothetical protein
VTGLERRQQIGQAPDRALEVDIAASDTAGYAESTARSSAVARDALWVPTATTTSTL